MNRLQNITQAAEEDRAGLDVVPEGYGSLNNHVITAASSWKGCHAYLALIFKTFEKLFPHAFLFQYDLFFSLSLVVCQFSHKREEDLSLPLHHPKGDNSSTAITLSKTTVCSYYTTES